jgi:hypothetical protein
MNATAHPPEVPPPARKEFLSDRWLLRLFVLAELAFAASVAAALLTADTHVHRPFGLFLPAQSARGERPALAGSYAAAATKLTKTHGEARQTATWTPAVPLSQVA